MDQAGARRSMPGELADERRAQILQAALACMARQGYTHTTMDDIANACGLSKGALYWYFPSKRDIFLNMLRAWFQETIQAMQAIAGDSRMGATERLARLAQATARIFRQDPEAMLLTADFWALSRQDQDFVDLMQEMYTQLLSLLEEVIAQGVDRGEFRPVATDQVAQIWAAMYDGLFFYASLGIPVDWEQVQDTLEDILLQGIGEPSPGGAR